VIAIARPFAARQAGADASDGTTAPTPTASPVPTPLAAPDYQALLASVDAAINPPMQQLIAAHTMAEVRTGAAGLAAATQSGYAKLTAATPPTAAATAHQNVVRAFSQFQDIAEDTASATRSGAVCSASAAVPKLTNSPGATALRAAATELAAVDPASPFKIGFWLPAATPEQSRRLANGAFVKKGTRNGSGQLKIDNTGGSKDVSMSLATAGAKTTAFAVYVRAGSSYTVTGVKDGTYDIYMTSGTDWDPVGPGFSRDCGFSKFDDPLAFKTTNSQYTIWTLTLKASAAGNASTAEVNPDEFPQ
jgi:hypothetical protein